MENKRTRHDGMTETQARHFVFTVFFLGMILFGFVMALFSFSTQKVKAEGILEQPSVVKHKENPVVIGGERTYNEISFIVVHHTATRDDLDAKQMKLSMQRTYINNRGGSVIPTHYIIDKRGNTERVNPIKKIVGATLNPIANIEGVHIELVGDFNSGKPTDAQYNTLNTLIDKIENEVGSPLLIKGHKDFQAKECPGVNFDWSRVVSQKHKVGDVIDFDQITAYYTPLPTDTIFSHKDYETSRKVNGDLVNAMGWDYKEEHKYHHGACGKRWEFGTILNIEGRGDVTCVDRGSAIDGNDIDIWYGIGEKALRNIKGEVVHPQSAKVTVVFLP